MLTLTYLVLVAGAAVVLWLAFARRTAGPAQQYGHPTPPAGGGRGRLDPLRDIVLGGPSRPAVDLVERMALCLVGATERIGRQLYATPGYLAAELSKGKYEAATAYKAELTEEVWARYTELQVDQARRSGRAGHEYEPAPCRLQLVLAYGPTERLMASFDPIVDVRQAMNGSDTKIKHQATPGAAGDVTTRRDGPTTTKRDQETTRRTAGSVDSVTWVLSVDDRPRAQRQLGDGTSKLTVGRASTADLSCPPEFADVSRGHAEITKAQGSYYAEDKGSANGTRIQRQGAAPEGLEAGQPVKLEAGDVLWLDPDNRVKVTQL